MNTVAFALALATGLALSGCAQPGSTTCTLASVTPVACAESAGLSAPSHVRTFDDELSDDTRYGGNGP